MGLNVSKWEKLAGETGEEVPSGRFGRMAKLGGLSLKVGASTVAGALGSKLIPRSRDKKRAAYERLMEKNAERVVKVLGQLKGASMKVGQILSADPDLVPPEFAHHLTSLQTQAPPMTYKTVKRQIEDALDQPMESIFSYFNPEPIGSASIGQVHRGTLHTGEDVAVKVQYPGILDSIRADLKNLATLMTFGRAVVDKDKLEAYLEEASRAAIEESDYELEAENLRSAFEDFKDVEGVRIPEPYEEWTRKPVLIMEYVEGVKLDDALAELGPGPKRQALLTRWISIYVWMFHERFELHSDPHPGNFLLTADNDLVVLDFGCVKEIEPELADGVLEILDAVWSDDPARAARLYQKLGFGAESADSSIYDAELIERYHDLILAPFSTEGPFRFGNWRVTMKAKRFFLRNPKMLKLTPPSDLLLYFRVLSGIKGLLMKLDAEMDLKVPAVAVAKRRGVYTAN